MLSIPRRRRLEFDWLADRICPSLLTVTSVTPTLSGVAVQFNEAFDPSTINLYNAVVGGLGQAHVTLKDAGNNLVNGSLVFDAAAGDRFSFVRTGGPMAPGNYTLAIRSGADA